MLLLIVVIGVGVAYARKALTARVVGAMIFILAVILIVAFASSSQMESRQRLEGATNAEAKSADATLNALHLARSKKQLSLMPASAPLRQVAALCDDIKNKDSAYSASSEFSQRCASAHLDVLRRAIRAGEAAPSRAAFDSAKRDGATPEVLARFEKPVKDLEKQYELMAPVRAALAAREREVDERRAYAIHLRDYFLDGKEDIGVEVSGKMADRITLRYVLMGAVRARAFQKGTLIDEIRAKGFRRVDLIGYDYHVYWDLSKP
jgi:hypothetical protein